MVKAVFDGLAKTRPTSQFTVGITDDVSRTSLPVDPEFDIEPPEVLRAVFFGLGSDGTVGANKNLIKIIGESTDRWVQGYFVYDSRKAGAMTISHLRMSPRPIRSASLIRQAGFLACHQFDFLDRYDVLGYAAPGGILLLNAPAAADRVWDQLPREVQTHILDKRLRVHVIDAYRVADDVGLGRRINTIMQTCFFALSGILPIERAIAEIKKTIQETYGKWGADTVQQNMAAVDQALAHLHEVRLPDHVTATRSFAPLVPDEAPDFVKTVTALMLAGKGDWLPVSAFPVDGTWPVGTARWDKRNLAQEIPVWDPTICIQCNKCAMVCPHAAIRAKVYAPAALAGAPSTFKAVDYKAHEFPGFRYTIQVAPEDCTGCNLCVMVCPAKDKSNPKHKAIDMQAQRPLREIERANYAFFLQLPEADRTIVKSDVKGIQFLEPLFEYSSACPGCGETPYLKLLTQLFGDRALIANATGCSSIYGGNLPTTPYRVNRDGRVRLPAGTRPASRAGAGPAQPPRSTAWDDVGR
jgi:pyruvate-ferredoxin/flavodoxin oxidoreductase